MHSKGFICAIGAAVTWGLVYSIDQVVLTTISPTGLLFLDSVAAAVITLPFAIISHQSISMTLTSDRNTLWLFLSLGLATGANLLIFYAIRDIGAPAAAFLEITYPLFVTVFAILLFRGAFSISLVLGGLLVLSGVLIIIRAS